MTPQWMKLIANLFSLARLLGWLTAWSPAALLIGAALWISSRAHAQETSPVWCSAAFVEATNANRKPPGETFPCYVANLRDITFECVGPYSCTHAGEPPPGMPALKVAHLPQFPIMPIADRLPRGAREYCAEEGTSEAMVGGIPPQPILWRCVKGAVYVCQPGADGIACSARRKSRVPFPSMVDACHERGQLSVADGALNYVWRWECRDGEPVIVGPQVTYDFETKTTTPANFDAQGYEEREWKPLR